MIFLNKILYTLPVRAKVRYCKYESDIASKVFLLLPLIGRTMRVDAYPGCRLTPFALPWAMNSLGFQPVSPH